MDTPLLYSQVDFVSTSEQLGITNETAVILDDIRFLIKAIIKQVDQVPTNKEQAKLARTSSWIRNRILDLPAGNKTDFIYKSCRIAALIYCRAIVERISLSNACTLQELNHLWASIWGVTLTRWKQIPGIFLFVILSANQAAQNLPQGMFLRAILRTSSYYITTDNWDVVDGALMFFTRLQRWLRNEYSAFSL
jgi:hypothetical protein